MRYLLCLAVLALDVPSWAAEETIPNPLTAKEAADGWLSLFDGETTFGWNIEGQAKVDKGMLILGGTEPTMAACTSQFTYGGFRFEALTDDAKDANLTFNAYKARPFIHVAPPQEKGWHGFGAQVMPDDISIWPAEAKGLVSGANSMSGLPSLSIFPQDRSSSFATLSFGLTDSLLSSTAWT